MGSRLPTLPRASRVRPSPRHGRLARRRTPCRDAGAGGEQPYNIGALHARVRGVYTNTVPVDAYRGAGRPEAAYVLERLVDRCARVLGSAPAEIRARNLVKSSQMPYRTQTNRTYDVGDFEGTLRACLDRADYPGFENRAEEATSRGVIRGIGIVIRFRPDFVCR